MTWTVSDLGNRVSRLIKPASGVTAVEIVDAVADALREVSRRSPETIEEDVTLTSSELDLSTGLGDWVEGSSSVRDVEYPVDYVPAELLSRRLWRVKHDGTTGYTLVVDTANVGEDIRVHYTIPHGYDTLSDGEGEALANLAAAALLEGMAARWAQKEGVGVAGAEYDGPSPTTLLELATKRREAADTLLLEAAAETSGEQKSTGIQIDLELT